ncbi:MAG: sensor histidine kinase [Acidimicrobiales bacterium]|nr:sensor histidine kinase [Acidimicrobiales bacterium]RZV42339.1 MAG: sensor histidine kinase [Acidimicrobiales bacterium]
MDRPAGPDAHAVIRGLIRLGEALSSSQPLAERLTKVCEETAIAVGCDRSSIFVLKGNYFHATYNFGNPPDIAENFSRFKVRRDDGVIAEAIEARSFVRINTARTDPRTGNIADAARIDSIVIAPMFGDAFDPIGFMTAEFNEGFGYFDELSAEVVLGAARVAQGAMMTARERLKRERSGRVQRDLLEQLVFSEDRERRRISADIHDDSLQRVTALMHELEAASQRIEDEELKAALKNLADHAAEAARSLRDFVQDVHPLSVDTGGLVGAIDTLLRRVGAENGWDVELIDATTDDIPRTAVAVLYRIAKQAIENIELHAKAQAVTVRVAMRGQHVGVSVTDDGIGFDPDEVEHDRYGLLMMQERAEFADGMFELMSQPGSGTTVAASVPRV